MTSQQSKDNVINSQTGNIVFIHMGTKPPRPCLFDALIQAASVESDARTILFTDDSHADSTRRELPNNIAIINASEVPKSQLHEAFLQQQVFSDWNDRFWQLTTERFFFLDDLMRHMKLSSVLHIESDVLIYRPLVNLISTRRGQASILYPLDRTRGIGSVMYFLDARDTGKLCAYALQKPHSNDMDLLGDFYLEHRDSGVASLPTIPEEICEQAGLDKERYTRPRQEGWGIFDAAAIGQFLGGIDPIHDRGPTIGFQNENSDLLLKSLDLTWRIESGRKSPQIHLPDNYSINNYPVNSLHLHSKRTGPFLSTAHSVPLAEDEIITGERIMTLTDVILTAPHKIQYHKILTPNMPPMIDLTQYHQNGTTKIHQDLYKLLDEKYFCIFIYGDLLRFVSNYITPYLEKKHILVVHNSDELIDHTYDHIFDNPNILHMFCQNAVTLHPKVTGVPIGLANPMWSHGNIAKFFEHTRTMTKGNTVYAKRIASTDVSRQKIFEILRRRGDVETNLTSKVSFDEYICELKQHRFVVCPRGYGVDTHRLWETLYLGSTPVITATELHRAVSSNYCHVLKTWEELIDLEIGGVTRGRIIFSSGNYNLSCYKNSIDNYR